jgi:hypothetical protein
MSSSPSWRRYLLKPKDRPWLRQFFDFVNEPASDNPLREAQRRLTRCRLVLLQELGRQADLDAIRFQEDFELLAAAADVARFSSANRVGRGVFQATPEELAWFEIESLQEMSHRALVRLRDSGKWKGVRRCARAACSRWFIGTAAAQFCTDRCRKSEYESTRAPRNRKEQLAAYHLNVRKQRITPDAK